MSDSELEILDRRGPIRVHSELKDVLLEFTVNCLLDQPEKVLPYANEYFNTLLSSTTRLVYEEEQESSSSSDYGFRTSDIPQRERGTVIYSEPYNPELDTGDEPDLVYEKTDEQKAMLKDQVKECLLFNSIDENDINRVIDAMLSVQIQAGDFVIRQGDDGDFYYVIESGAFEAFKHDNQGQKQHLFMYDQTGSFGELALMYNMPRAATVRALSDGILWALDRKTFRRIVLRGAYEKRKKYEKFLKKVPLLKELNNYEKMSVADALVQKEFVKDEVIIREDDECVDRMYFIESGTCAVSMYDSMEQHDKVIKELSVGDYFGELALVTNNSRAGTITAISDVVVAYLDKGAFERLLGPCLHVIRRNISLYENQVIRKFGRKPHVYPQAM